jgi:hypothetical protein
VLKAKIQAKEASVHAAEALHYHKKNLEVLFGYFRAYHSRNF